MDEWEIEHYSRDGYGRRDQQRPVRQQQPWQGSQQGPRDRQGGQQRQRQGGQPRSREQQMRDRQLREQQMRRDQQHRQAPPRKRPPRRRSKLPAIIVIAVVAIIAIVGIGFAVSAGQQTSTVVADNDISTSAVDEAASQAASQSDSTATTTTNTTQSGSGGFGLVNDLSWRDTDFPVDPNKPCGSNKDNGRKTVYLTIDDGPSELTAQVLDILDQYNCKATFFVTGQNPDYLPMIAEAYRRGHTIGLHTWSHDYDVVYSSVDAYFSDLDQIGEAVKQQIGYVPCFIRFPGGTSNTISANYTPGIMGELVNEVNARGYQYYDWDISCGDGSEHTADELVQYSMEGDLEENIVFLCHDGAGKQTTVEALPRIIEYYQGLGYTFEAMDRTTWTPHHPVNN